MNMSTTFDPAWIQYLKNNRIVEMKSDPVSGRLVYRRPVRVDDVAAFLILKVDIEEDEIQRVIERTVPWQARAVTGTGEQSGFVDLPGAEVSESDVRSIFADVAAWLAKAESDLREREASAERVEVQGTWIDGLMKVATVLTPEQRAALASMVLAMRSGLVPLSPRQISATIQALVKEQRAAEPKSGFFASLLSGKASAPNVVGADEIEQRWVAGGAPIDESSFLAFLAANGFDRGRSRTALNLSSDDTDADVFASDEVFRLMLDLAEKVKDADEDRLLAQLERIKVMGDDAGVVAHDID